MSVKDTGPGIPEEEIPIVLASFGQGSNSIKSAEQGAGLGLPIAKNLIDLHGGTFTLKSKLRIGTEVVVTFPPERVMWRWRRLQKARRRCSRDMIRGRTGATTRDPVRTRTCRPLRPRLTNR